MNRVPETGVVHLWEVDLDAFRGPNNLSEEELARAARFKFERDRSRFIAGRTALRIVLGGFVEKVVFRYGPAGKPFVEGVSFNLAHSGRFALIGVAEGEIGVDIEEVRPLEDIVDTARAAFAPGEFNRWRNAPEAERLDLFYRIWTRKEAYLKAIGEGIAQRLHLFEVDFEEPGILTGAEGGWSLADISRVPDYIAAVALPEPIKRIERHMLLSA